MSFANVVVLTESYAIAARAFGGIMNTHSSLSEDMASGRTKTDPRGRKVKILATIGPASLSPSGRNFR